MVFVIVGNARQNFARLLNAVAAEAAEGCLRHEIVLVQAGNNSFTGPPNCKSERFFPPEDFLRHIEMADLVITHAGAGTIIQVLQNCKVPVVMPRRKKYHEHVDDHQMELTMALAAEGKVIPAYEPVDLAEAIRKARRGVFRPPSKSPAKMIALLEKAIRGILGEP